MKSIGETQPSNRHLVVLLHGINTRGLWIDVVRPILEKFGFSVAPTSYGRYSILRFLLPFRFFRRAAEARVLKSINSAIVIYQPTKISVIAHSFGTYVFFNIMADHPEIIWHRIILCGSVVSEAFPLEQYLSRFTVPIVNEVGTSDYLPALAESLGWGYGSIGSNGLHHPAVITRWHANRRHSDFLRTDFAERFWIPFLSDGTVVSAQNPTQMPLLIRTISSLRLRYFTALIFLVCLFAAITFTALSFTGANLTGVIVDQFHNPVPSAVISLAEVGTTISRLDGTFNIYVRRSLRRSVYSIEVSAREHETLRISSSAADVSKQSLIITKVQPDLNNFVDLDPILTLSQNVGDPLLMIGFRVKQTDLRSNLIFYHLEITSPDHKVVRLVPVVAQRNNIPYQNQYLNEFSIENEPINTFFVFLFAGDLFSKFATINLIANDVGADWLNYCGSPRGLDQRAVDKLSDYFNSAFFWKEGEYNVDVSYGLNGDEHHFNRLFSITATESSGLFQMKNRINRCGGVFLMQSQLGNIGYSDASAFNSLIVRPTIVGR